MKIKDLFDSVDFNDVMNAIERYYPGQIQNIDGYRNVFYKIRDLTPVDTKMTVHIELCKDDEDNLYPNVYGIEQGVNETWGLEFVPWEEWLDMDFIVDSLMSDDNVAAACLFEMTFFGFTQDVIKNKLEEINEIVDEAKQTASIQ